MKAKELKYTPHEAQYILYMASNEPYKSALSYKQFRRGARALKRAGIFFPKYLQLLANNIQTSNKTGQLLAFLHSHQLLTPESYQLIVANIKHTRRLLGACRDLLNRKALNLESFMLMAWRPTCDRTFMLHLIALRRSLVAKFSTEFFELVSKFGFKVDQQSNHKELESTLVFTLNAKRLVDTNLVRPDALRLLSAVTALIVILYAESWYQQCLKRLSKTYPENMLDWLEATNILKASNLLTESITRLLLQYGKKHRVKAIASFLVSVSTQPWFKDFLEQLQKHSSDLSQDNQAINILTDFRQFTEQHITFILNANERSAYLAKGMSILLSEGICSDELQKFVLSVSRKAIGYFYHFRKNFTIQLDNSPEKTVAELLVFLAKVNFITSKNLRLLLNVMTSMNRGNFESLNNCCRHLDSVGLLTQNNFEILCKNNTKERDHLFAIREAMASLAKCQLLTQHNFDSLIISANLEEVCFFIDRLGTERKLTEKALAGVLFIAAFCEQFVRELKVKGNEVTELQALKTAFGFYSWENEDLKKALGRFVALYLPSKALISKYFVITSYDLLLQYLHRRNASNVVTVNIVEAIRHKLIAPSDISRSAQLPASSDHPDPIEAANDKLDAFLLRNISKACHLDAIRLIRSVSFLIKNNRFDFESIPSLIDSSQLAAVIHSLEDLDLPIASFVCGLLLEGRIANPLEEDFRQSSDQELKRTQDAISFYIKALVDKRLRPFVETILWEIKTTAVDLDIIYRLEFLDLSPPLINSYTQFKKTVFVKTNFIPLLLSSRTHPLFVLTNKASMANACIAGPNTATEEDLETESHTKRLGN